MNDLGPQTIALLAAARGGDDPPPGERLRVRAAVTARVASGVTALGVSAVAGRAAAALRGATSVALAWKAVTPWVLVGVMGSGAIAWHEGGVGFARRATQPAPGSTRETSARVTRADVTPATSALVTRAGVTPAPMTRSAFAGAGVERPLPAQSVAVERASPAVLTPNRAPASGRTARSGRATEDPASIEAEIATIAAAHAGLESGDAARALARLDSEPRGPSTDALAEERDLLRIEALCALGKRREGQASAQRFLRDYPDSPYAARARSACADGERSGPPEATAPAASPGFRF